MDNHIYDTLLGLPLFQGLTKSAFDEVLSKVCFNFEKISAGTRFVSAGSPCNSFKFILNGKVTSQRRTLQEMLILIETVEGPFTMEISSMFGINPSYRCDYTALTDVGILSIDKSYLYDELFKYDVCRMNMMNILSNREHTLDNMVWNLRRMDLRERFVFLIRLLCESQKGEKIVKVKMEDVAQFLCQPRMNVSKMLNALQDEGLLELHRGTIVIPRFELL